MGKRTELIKQIKKLSDNSVEKIYKKVLDELKITKEEKHNGDLSEFFGIFNWQIDSVDYQRKLRDEWD